MLRLLTAGESHGKTLVGIIEGLPANMPIDVEKVNHDLWRRQQGYGRGGRMKIETDTVEILSGVRAGLTIASPVAFAIQNKDYTNWKDVMDPLRVEQSEERVVRHARPGHADLSGAIKYGFSDMRNVLERSSARETAVRVAAGSILRQLLAPFAIEVASHVIRIGSIECANDWDAQDVATADQSPVRCCDSSAAAAMMQEIDQAKADGDSLGGVFEVVVTGAPVGLGSYVHWDRKLDAKLAYALMSIQAIKGVEIGDGFAAAGKLGSQVHDEIIFDTNGKIRRRTNRAGGIEGGMSNGEQIRIRCAMKPIPTLYKPLQTINLVSKEAVVASVERSDSCAVPACSIVGELVATSVIAEELMRLLGADTMEEMIRRWSESM